MKPEAASKRSDALTYSLQPTAYSLRSNALTYSLQPSAYSLATRKARSFHG